MAPIPPIITRLVATYLAQALTRRLQQSPAFFRMVDRLVHEADHLPLRLQGKDVPPYRRIDPHEPTMREMAEDAWQRQVDDPGEPHDMPDPFKPQQQQQQQQASGSIPGSAPQTFEQARASRRKMSEEQQRQRAREAMRAAQRGLDEQGQRPQHTTRQGQSKTETHRDQPRNDLRALLDKMREEQAQRNEDNGDQSRAKDPRQD